MKDFKIAVLNGEYKLTLMARDLFNNLDVATITISKEYAEKIILNTRCEVVHH